MKKYKRAYERVFTNKRQISKCDLRNVSTDIGLTGNEYKLLLRKTIRKFQKELFSSLMRIDWMLRRYTYCDLRRKKKRGNGWLVDRSYGVFMRHIVGYDNRSFSKNQFYTKISSYFEDLFPGYLDKPIKKRYKYPYRFMTLECLIVVAQMKERLEILAHAEKRRMEYTRFLDYVINYIYCYNDDVGYDYYIWQYTNVFLPYVAINSKYRDK